MLIHQFYPLHIVFPPDVFYIYFILFYSTSRAVYKLMAVIVHIGTVDDGHYITYRRFETEHASKWLYASDEVVEAASRDQVLLSSAYMLFYERTRK